MDDISALNDAPIWNYTPPSLVEGRGVGSASVKSGEWDGYIPNINPNGHSSEGTLQWVDNGRQK